MCVSNLCFSNTSEVLAAPIGSTSALVTFDPAALTSITAPDTGPLKIQFVASEPCGLVMFLNILAERHHTSRWVKDWYDRKCRMNRAFSKNSESDKEPLESYKQLIDMEDKHFHYVDEIGRSRSVDEVILREAARSTTIPELLDRLKQTLSLTERVKLQTVLYYFEPIYQQLIWKPCLPSLTKQVEEFRKRTESTQMCEHLTEVKRFLNSPWSSATPFIVALAPLPTDGKSTHGQSLGVVQTVELRPGDHFQKSADVVFHEAVHALWFSKKDEEETTKLFYIPEKGALPLTELYEGMATALGQGWYTKLAFGHTGNSWYADPIINRYSQVVYPLYEDYLKQRRPLDAQFAHEATACYYRMYPDSDKQINLTSSYLILADEMQDFRTFRKSVYDAMPRLRECSISTPINAREGVDSFEKSHAVRAAILTSVSKLDFLKSIGLSQVDIDRLKRIQNGYSTANIGSKKVLFCLAETSEGQKKIFADVLKQSKWP